jgi:hypothetical protein
MRLLKLFKKNKSKDMSDQVMAEEKKDVVKYQWKKGEKFGKVVEVESTDSKFINFTDGSRIFKNVVSEFLEKIQGNQLPLPGADIVAVKLSGEPSIPTPQTGPIQDQTNTVATNSSNAVITQPTPAKEPTVMGKMIMKMSKKNVVNVPIQINLNIPTQALYAMLSEGMEEEDLNEEIMEVALSQIEMDKLQEYIKSNVSDFLAKYYS